jgi:thiol-disulfide isomerase/thioredoxin
LEYEVVEGERRPRVSSISGYEPNKLFVNRAGEYFEDGSQLSGADELADGRCFVIWDYDHDGAQDLALININTPHVQIFRNQLADSSSLGHFIAVRLVGGNDKPKPSPIWSNRDGIGAMVNVQCGDKRYVREKRCGEGFSGQNSETLIVGIGKSQLAKLVTVKWPSGRVQELANVPAGKLLVFCEDQSVSPDQSAVQQTSYPAITKTVRNDTGARQRGKFDFTAARTVGTEPAIKVYFTMATWCTSCRDHLPLQRELIDRLDDNKVEFFAVPVDVSDTAEKLAKYDSENKLPYRLLSELTNSDRAMVADHIRQELGTAATPCTVVTDGDGHPLETFFGIPTLSDIRRLAAKCELSRD